MKLRKSRNLLSLICFGRWSRKPHPIERLEKGLGRENCSLMMYTMNTQVAIVLGCITAAIILMVHMTQALELITGVDAAYPSQDSSFCQVGSDGTAKRLRQIIDITHAYREDLPCWLSEDGLGSRTRLVHSIAEGEVANLSELRFDVVHSGTHVDAPGHFVQEYYEQGPDVASLDLNVLLGPVLLVDAPRGSNLTAQVLEALHIPPGVERIILRTLNTDKRLMWNRAFDSSYVGVTEDGADWIIKHSQIKLVGIDYLSAVSFDDLVAGHQILLGKKLILVEGLNLDDVEMGLYNLHCLPLKLPQAEGCPIRCVLTT